MALRRFSTSLSANGSSTDSCEIFGNFSLVIRNTGTATASLERSVDGGTTWDDVTDEDGNQQTWSSNATVNGLENTRGALYRLKVASYSSGTVTLEVTQ